MNRIVSVQDISAVGKCSLTVALPIISAFGVECAVLPTAVLSTHTQFQNFTFRDLTEEMEPIYRHWKQEGLAFDAICTGYLGSFEQIRIVEEMAKELKGENTVVVVDPVMADNGVLYRGFTPAFARRMGEFCAKADLILPNLTEAYLMLEEPYRETYDRAEIRRILKKLCEKGTKMAALTGVSYEKGKIGVELFNSQTGEFFSYFNEYLPVSFHGTGDIFASAVVGGIQSHRSVEEALTIAVDFTLECIRRTLADPNHVSYGVNFEEALPYLISRLAK